MPVPTCVCAICNQTVHKCRTLHIGDGKRACKEHEGVLDKSVKAMNSVKSIHEIGRRPKKLHKDREIYDRNADFVLRCAVCNMPGLRQDMWFSRLLMNQAKYEIIYGKTPNPFNADEMLKSAGDLVGVPCLWYVKWEGDNTKIRLSLPAYQAAQLLGVTLICSECCDKHHASEYSKEQINELTPDQLQNWLMVTTMVHKDLLKDAAKDMATTN